MECLARHGLAMQPLVVSPHDAIVRVHLDHARPLLATELLFVLLLQPGFALLLARLVAGVGFRIEFLFGDLSGIANRMEPNGTSPAGYTRLGVA